MNRTYKITKRISVYEAKELLAEMFANVGWDTERLNNNERQKFIELIEIINTQTNNAYC